LRKNLFSPPSLDNVRARLSEYPLELLQFRRLGFLTPAVQIVTVAALYGATTLVFARGFRLTGKMLGHDPDVWILFVPITEEILFRGFILGALEIAYGPWRAIVFSSLLFGLWHLKNTFWMTDYGLLHQMVYTTFLFGPVTAYLALRLRTIWIGVILHYLNNFPTALLLSFWS
jgi:membrane protease YdiL (CAAX protease family)